MCPPGRLPLRLLDAVGLLGVVLVLADDPVHGAQLRAHDPHQVVQVADDVDAQQRRADGQDVEVKLEREKKRGRARREINEISSFHRRRRK